MKKCSEFKMSVAFISWGGIQNFFPLFEELQQRIGKGQILTSTYEDFTTPEAFDVMQFKPKHMLFIVHRDNILEKSCESFKHWL